MIRERVKMMNVNELVRKYSDYNLKLRREFHMIPEPSMNEVKTQQKIMEELKKIEIPCRKAAGTGVVAYIRGGRDGRTLALRADTDALEIQEANDIGYRSTHDGLMHACAHDGHISSLLTAARILTELKDELKGTVKLIFQPGEETGEGARRVISEGELKEVDGIFGLHIMNYIEAGKVTVEAGPRMASAGTFRITIKGRGGHASKPHQGVDAIVVGAAMVMNLQTLVSREFNPLDPTVLTVGVFNAGTRFNVMAGEAVLEGTSRCFNMEINDVFEEKIRRVVENTAAVYRAEATLEYEQMVIPVINDEYMSSIGEEAVRKTIGPEHLLVYGKTTGGEDFSYYGQEVPAAFALVGGGNDAKMEYHPHHNSRFCFDEDVLDIASGLYAQYALDYLNDKGQGE